MKEKSLKVKKVYSLFYVMLIGAVGSGFWDLFLKDLLYWCGEVFVNLASSLYQGYFDRLYEDVGRQSDKLLYLPSVFIIVLIILSPIWLYFFITIRLRRIETIIDDEEPNRFECFLISQFENHRARLKVLLLIPALMVSISYLDMVIVSATSIRAVRSIELRIDVLRPYISDKASYKLISDFRLVKDRVGMQDLINNIDGLAKQNEIDLPELRLYGIESSIKRVN